MPTTNVCAVNLHSKQSRFYIYDLDRPIAVIDMGNIQTDKRIMM